MTRTRLLRELRRMRFEEAYGGWQEERLTQEEAARLLGGVRAHVPALRGALRGRGARRAGGQAPESGLDAACADCVSFECKRLQIPAQTHRCRFIKVRVRVHRYPDGRLSVFHGPRKLADYEPDGALVAQAPTAEHEPRARSAAAGRFRTPRRMRPRCTATCAGLLDWTARIARLALPIRTDKTRIACVPNRSHHREDARPNPSP